MAQHTVSILVASTVMTSFIGSGTELQHSLTNAYHILLACPAGVCRVCPDSRESCVYDSWMSLLVY